MQQTEGTSNGTSNTYKLIALLLIITVFCGFTLLTLYEIDHKALVFFGQDTDKQVFSVFCVCIVLWCFYGIFRIYQPKTKQNVTLEEPPDSLTFKQYGSRFGLKGKLVFALFIAVLLFIMVMGIYNLATGQTPEKVTPTQAFLLSLALFFLCSGGIFLCLKAAFYEYSINIDPALNYVTHHRAFLLWSSKTSYSFSNIQYVMPSPRKFLNRYVAFNVSYGGRHNKSYVSFIYIKPYNAKPILFLESSNRSEVNDKSKELAQLLGCGIYTPNFTNFSDGYW